MAIIVSRPTGTVCQNSALTQQQKDELWAQIVRAFAQSHPEDLRESVQEDSSLATA